MRIIETSWAGNLRMIHIGRGHSTTPIESGEDSAEAYRKSAEELRRLADECEQRGLAAYILKSIDELRRLARES